jgi:aspartate aminotransferase
VRENGNLALSRYVQAIEASSTLAITTKVAELRRQGKTIIDLGAGEPDFPTPEKVCEAGIKAIQDGKTKYTPNAGLLELRERIAAFVNSYGGDYHASQILVCCGAKQAIFHALLAVCNPEDEAIVLSPYWTSYPQQVKMAGAQPVLLHATEQNGYKITAGQLQNAITPKTKLLIFNSPCNPTGAVYTNEELASIVHVISQSGIYVLSDEIYMKLVYDGLEPVSLASFPQIRNRLILVNGLSKSHAMTGWRVGYLAAGQQIVKAAAKVQSHTTSNITSISQYAAMAAFDLGSDEFENMRTTFAERRDYVVGRLQNMPGVKISVPKGAFYVYPKISSFFRKTRNKNAINSPLELAAFLLENAEVAVVPGEAFGSTENIRLSYANSMENLSKAMDQIDKALRLLL